LDQFGRRGWLRRHWHFGGGRLFQRTKLRLKIREFLVLDLNLALQELDGLV
jgi:hypothetical protein